MSIRSVKLCGAVDEVDTTVGINDAAELADLETKGCIFKRLLHLASLEEAQIASGFGRRAVADVQSPSVDSFYWALGKYLRVNAGQRRKIVLCQVRLQLAVELVQLRDGVFL